MVRIASSRSSTTGSSGEIPRSLSATVISPQYSSLFLQNRVSRPSPAPWSPSFRPHSPPPQKRCSGGRSHLLAPSALSEAPAIPHFTRTIRQPAEEFSLEEIFLSWPDLSAHRTFRNATISPS